MRRSFTCVLVGCLVLLLAVSASWGAIFEKSEYTARRARLIEKIPDGVAILLGAQPQPGYMEYYQNNDFIYLTGVEIPNAVLVVDGRKKESTLFCFRETDLCSC